MPRSYIKCKNLCFSNQKSSPFFYLFADLQCLSSIIYSASDHHPALLVTILPPLRELVTFLQSHSQQNYPWLGELVTISASYPHFGELVTIIKADFTLQMDVQSRSQILFFQGNGHKISVTMNGNWLLLKESVTQSRSQIPQIRGNGHTLRWKRLRAKIPPL